MTEDDLRAKFAGLGVRLEDLEPALLLARKVHGSGLRDDGAPYLEEHVFPIAHDVAAYLSERTGTGSTDVLAGTVVALLHDCLEDCLPEAKEAVGREIEAAYGWEILGAVETLTKTPKKHYSGLSPSDAKSRREDDYMGAIQVLPTWCD